MQPLAMLLVFLSISFLKPVQDWNTYIRIYFPGILVVMFIWKFFIVVGLLTRDLLTWVQYFGRMVYRMGKTGRKPLGSGYFPVTAGLWIGTLFSGLMFASFFFWVYDFKVREVEVNLSQLPASYNGFRILQLSDIHLGSIYSDKPLHDAVELSNALKPDIILFTGDIVNFITDEAYPFRDVLKNLKAPMGIYCVLGNHDYGDYVQWKSTEERDRNNTNLQIFYESIGWKLLNNAHVILRRGNDSIALIGTENWSSKSLWGKKGNLTKALQGIESVPVKILMTHDPTHWRRMVIKRFPDIDLTFSGHTHAMQMGWETSKYRWSPAKWLFPEWAGLYRYESKKGEVQYLYVNRGLGHLGFPGRIGIRPEITLIILQKH